MSSLKSPALNFDDNKDLDEYGKLNLLNSYLGLLLLMEEGTALFLSDWFKTKAFRKLCFWLRLYGFS